MLSLEYRSDLSPAIYDLPAFYPNVELQPVHAGRRARVFFRIWTDQSIRENFLMMLRSDIQDDLPTLRSVLQVIEEGRAPAARKFLESLPVEGLRRRYERGSLHPIWQDLADDWIEDIREAARWFVDPRIEFRGVSGDEDPRLKNIWRPVDADYVRRVIENAQLELNEERRPLGLSLQDRKPALPLTELPEKIQYALAERRRLRFLQYGIDWQAWKTGKVNFWNIFDDPWWRPKFRSS